MKEQRIGFISDEPRIGKNLIVQCTENTELGNRKEIFVASKIEEIKILNEEQKLYRVETENMIFYVQYIS